MHRLTMCLVFMDWKKNYSNCSATLKQTRKNSWNENRIAFLSQNVILSTTKTKLNESYFPQISQSQKYLEADESYQKEKIHQEQSTSLTAQIKESTIVLVCCML